MEQWAKAGLMLVNPKYEEDFTSKDEWAWEQKKQPAC